jgi:thymidylate synthase (FAD)
MNSAAINAEGDEVTLRIITEPSVYLVGKQMLNQAELDRFLADHGVAWKSDSDVAAEVISEANGRICYMSFATPRPGGNSAYLHHIKEVGHGSVLEGAVWNFIFTGVSRSLLAELTRHRAGTGFSVLSQRYVDESVAEYVVPDIIACDPELMPLWEKAVTLSHSAYVDLSDKLNERLKDPTSRQAATLPPGADRTTRRKTARQAARSVLPNATETKIGFTANARALRFVIEQRGSRHAEPEIRKLANKLLDLMVGEAPNLFADYVRVPLPDGTFEVTTPYPKV